MLGRGTGGFGTGFERAGSGPSDELAPFHHHRDWIAGRGYDGYGEALARILSRASQIEVTAQVTQGGAQNIVLMEKKEALLGFVTTGLALRGWDRTDWASGTRYRSMRVIFPMYDTAFHFAVLKRLAIKSLDDFGGLRIGVGPRAGTGGTYVPEIFKLLGVSADIRFGAIEHMVSQLTGGKLDGVVIAAGFPIPALAELDAKQQVQVRLRPAFVRAEFHHPEQNDGKFLRQ